MVGTAVFANIVNVACSREVVLELVERASHDSVSQVKGFLDTVTMMDVDIYIQNSLVGFQELKDGQDAVIDVAEP